MHDTVTNDPFAGIPKATPESIAALRAPADFKALCRLALHISKGRLCVRTPLGEALVFEGQEPGPSGVCEAVRWRCARRILLGGANGASDAYIDGDWDSPDLTNALEVFAANTLKLEAFLTGTWLRRNLERLFHLLNRNTRGGARRNILAHYDLGNRFYERWLDPSMTYSAARFQEGSESLEAAQQQKYEDLVQRIDLRPGERVLEIGCGWGGFAEYAAKTRGAEVTGVTLSDSQLGYANKRIAEAGLQDRVNFQLQDYRDVDGHFDKIVSIEMFEAVGREYWTRYFQKVRDLLKAGGTAGLQIITISDERFDTYAKRADFIQRYIFPGGMLPSKSALKDEFGKAGLHLKDTLSFGQDYAQTLRHWRERFHDAWDDICALGFDERFKRIWRYYLAYCEAGFRTAATDVAQYVVSRP
jgi:cyclopropane-fatty-acyl-phospholipid synthase